MTKHALKAIGYPRVSTAEQGTGGHSLGDQIRAIEEYCQTNNIELVAHFREIESAATIEERPAYLAALSFLYGGGADLLIVTNLDRASRSLLDSELVRRDFARHGKKLISIQEQFLTPLGGIHEDDDYLEAAIQHRYVEAEQERKRIAKRCARGKKRKIALGGWGGHRPPYEYDVIQGELVLNPERWRYVRHLYRLFKLRTVIGRRVFSWQDMADYMNGNNNLIDPATGKRGRRFPCARDRMLVKKRLTPYKEFREPVWHRASIREICLEMDSGERLRWQASTQLKQVS